MSVATISDRLEKAGRVMADYRVIFFNNLVNSYGKIVQMFATGYHSQLGKRRRRSLRKSKTRIRATGGCL
jgi:hypothetical protein